MEKQKKQVSDSPRKLKQEGFAFARENYMILIAGILIIGIGYLLMIGGGSDDPNVFSTEIFSTRRITVAPIVCLIGFSTVLYAIMRKPREN
jgi:hypothetical protein